MLSSCFETTSHAHALLNLVSNASIERDDLMIDCPDRKIDFRAAEPAQAVLRCTHQLGSESAPAILGRNGQVVDPAPHAVATGDHRADKGPLNFADEKQLGLDLQLVRDHDLRCVPRWIVRAHARPETLPCLSRAVLAGTHRDTRAS